MVEIFRSPPGERKVKGILLMHMTCDTVLFAFRKGNKAVMGFGAIILIQSLKIRKEMEQ